MRESLDTERSPISSSSPPKDFGLPIETGTVLLTSLRAVYGISPQVCQGAIYC